MLNLPKGTPVVNRDGSQSGKTTGGERLCRQVEGCTGVQVAVRWPDGRLTWPCSRGMDHRTDGSWRIL